MLVPGPRGTQVRNPISMTLASYRQSLKTSTLLGLSPASRQSIDVPNPQGRSGGLNVLQEIQWSNCCSKLYRLHGLDWRAHMTQSEREIYEKDSITCEAMMRRTIATRDGAPTRSRRHDRPRLLDTHVLAAVDLATVVVVAREMRR